MYDIEREQIRKTYQLCRLGFFFLAAALSVACFESLLDLVGRFDHGHGLLTWIHGFDWYQWLGTPITWASAIGAILLWGRWNHTSWQRRAGLFLLMNLADLVLWFIARSDTNVAGPGDFGHLWLRDSLGHALGWGEFALMSSLSCDYLVHLGVEHARDSDKSTRSMAATGAMLWLLLFCQRTDWGAGWPLQVHRLRGLEGRLLYHGSNLIWTITLIQVTALVISAVRQSTYVLHEMDKEDEEHDLLRPRSDASYDLERAAPLQDDTRHPW